MTLTKLILQIVIIVSISKIFLSIFLAHCHSHIIL